jgi:transcription-repair coupling factor (superfamily II helicase)
MKPRLSIWEKEIASIENKIAEDKSKLHLRGLAGSAAAFISASFYASSPVTQLVVLDDKEKAAYFLNDLESILEIGTDEKEQEKTPVLFFPRTARLAYDIETTQNANIAIRTEVLNKLQKNRKNYIIVSYPEALFEKVVTQHELEKNTFSIDVGQSYSMDFIDEVFIEFQFEKVDYVYEPGQYAVRGGIVDVFSFSYEYPYRIEFFDEEVESIRNFDPATQLSVNKMTKAVIVPNTHSLHAEEVRIGLLEFLPENTVVWLSNTESSLAQFQAEMEKAEERFSRLSNNIAHEKPEALFTSKTDWLKQLENKRVIEFGSKRQFMGETEEFHCTPQPSFNKNFELLAEHLENLIKQGYKAHIVAGQSKQLERLDQIFQDKKKDIAYIQEILEISEGFVDQNKKILYYTDHQIFQRYHRFKLKEGFKKNKEALTLKEILALQPGDYVVHIDHGVGQFSGLQKIDVNGKEQEAIRLTYKGGDILYVSIHSLHRISKFTGKEGTAPTMDKLGSNAWQNLKRKTKTKVKEIAFDLIKLYAKRKSTKGFAFQPDTYMQTELEASFMYEDTPDQYKASVAVKEDMEAAFPMDRLVCGDVGFGKTEIAIRAACKAVADGKQVAVLVPTTILSIQHYKSFRSRLKDFPVTIEYINRFKTAKQNSETLERVKNGKVDILIGTHAILGKRVVFHDLGLMVIDEEQKFGVAAKDKLKMLRANVDALTLTATPIPRTLQFSLMGARDLSIIQTPPPNRVPIRTELIPFGEEIVRDAISYEVQRGGQVFFVHNRVQNLREMAGLIQRVCPDVRIGIGHGQLSGEDLEEVMNKFIEGEFDVLVSTSIVESGIDIPNANTIIINDAHHFGMSDLHQLRGRVGRNNKQAFCYLLSPPTHMLTDDAKKRLTAIEQFSDLGSGMHIAMRDLDIRGAGNLLGGEQSGFINELGFETYQKILDEALQELKQEHFQELYEEEMKKNTSFVKDTALETDFELLIPDEYVGNISERIALYKALDDMEHEEEIQKFSKDLEDRFGPIPKPVIQLIDTMRLRWKAREIGFEKLVLKSGKMIGYFISKQDSPFYQSEAFTRILNFIKLNPVAGKMYEKDDTLRIAFPEVQNMDKANRLLNALAEGSKL